MKALSEQAQELLNLSLTNTPESTKAKLCVSCGKAEAAYLELPGGKRLAKTMCKSCEAKAIAIQKQQARKAALLKKPKEFEGKLIRCGLEKRELNCRFGNFVVTPNNKMAYRAAWDFAHRYPDEGKGVFLISTPGAGKTHLSAATAKILTARKIGWRFYKVTDMLGYLRSCFREHSGTTEEEAIEKLSAIPVLFLDDFGAERTTDYAIDALYRVIDRRYRRELPVFATSNLTFEELSRKVDDRIPSRLAAMCRVVAYKGTDRRLKR